MAGADEVLARIRGLTHRAERDRTGLHFAEGVRNVLQALDAGVSIDTLILSEVLLTNTVAAKRVRLARRAGVATVRVSPEEFLSVSQTPRASGVGAIVRQHWTPLARADPARGLCSVAVRELRSPGNLGTIVRTLEAVGASRLICLGGRLDPFDPDVVRASMGGIFHIEIVRASLPAFDAWARAARATVVGATPRAPQTYTRVPLTGPLVLLFGEERAGLGPDELGVCTHGARIPIAGRADSLNVAIAAGVLLYEVRRRRDEA